MSGDDVEVKMQLNRDVGRFSREVDRQGRVVDHLTWEVDREGRYVDHGVPGEGGTFPGGSGTFLFSSAGKQRAANSKNKKKLVFW